ncbi:transporter [Paenibacillus polymyxa]|uniref:efflux RND transporter periplasmic adaptor subunit n=1 Tax=Paenibacillus polymyxa TaxID=1406 RepID=UPI0005CE1478|nr:efflux RND transporter periplasmic adaptor subunit [Paenibacillus polymyxa]KJD37365.1 transporter [Paenibacillus polymyxa]
MFFSRKIFWIGLACVVVSTTGCAANQESSASTQSSSNVPVVQIHQITKESLQTSSELSGVLMAGEERTLSFENGGRIVSTEVAIGSKIAKGSILARLDEADDRLQIEQSADNIADAIAGIESADARIQSANASISAAEAGIATAEANASKVKNGARRQEKTQAQAAVDKAQSAYVKAQTDARRINQLYEAGASSLSDHESTQLAALNAAKDLEQAKDKLSLLVEGATQEDYRTSQAAVKEAQAARISAIADQAQAKASGKQAKANYEKALLSKKLAELNLSKSQLIAPFNAVVLKKAANAGELVASGQTIYQIGSIQQLKVLLPVPDSEIFNWKKGQSVQISLYDEIKKGKITNIYPTTNADTGTINVEVSVPNDDHNWVPGQVVKAAHKSVERQSFLIPTEAVIQQGKQTYVFKIAHNKAVKTQVKLGDHVTVNKLEISSGVSEGDVIVVKGASTLFDGDKVEVVEGGQHD